MTIERKVGMGIAGQPSGGAADVAEVFSTYLYTGNNSTQTITNGIDLDGEGGLTWIKGRTAGYGHNLYDTERGATNSLASSSIAANAVKSDGLTAFNSNGFSLGSSGSHNTSGQDYVSWTFRNSKKFFKAVTFSYGGSSASPTVVTHDLGCTVGMTFVKQTNGNQNWYVQHKDVTGTDNNGALNLTMLFTGGSGMSTSFTSITNTQATFGAAASFPAGTYVAYFFADNSSEDAEEQMIKCGSYTGIGDTDGPFVNLGWEPQFVLIKNAQRSDNWLMVDTMRGMPNVPSPLTPRVFANATTAEGATYPICYPDSLGFKLHGEGTAHNWGGETFIYMAIRAPMMKEPEAATDVFNISVGLTGSSLPSYNSNFPVDMALTRRPASSETWSIQSRMTGAQTLQPNSIAVEGGGDVERQWDYMNGWGDWTVNTTTHYAWNWKRAKSYFDVVCYTGNTTAGRTVPHSLSVIPEMMWVKCRTDTTSWMVYHAALTGTKYLVLNTTAAPVTHDGNWYNTNPTDSVFTVGDGATNVAQAQIAYLFATSSGVSKVGSYTGNGSSQTINCGFSAGSRFILIKRTDAIGDWYVWDSARGIVAGNDPHLSLKSTSAQITNDDSVDPHNSGFIVNQVSATNINVSSATYIFYAIA